MVNTALQDAFDRRIVRKLCFHESQSAEKSVPVIVRSSPNVTASPSRDDETSIDESNLKILVLR